MVRGATVVVSVGIVRLNPDDLGVVGDGAVEVVLVEIGVATVVVGEGIVGLSWMALSKSAMARSYSPFSE